MKLVGVTRITSKKTGNTMMKLSLLDSTPNPNRVGADVSTEFADYNEEYLSLVGKDINIHYRKSFDGRAIFDHLEVVGKEASK